MKCPFCNNTETKVLETRETEDDITRRRRSCLKCEKRFTTYEQVELTNIFIVKRDGSKQLFDKQKILKSMQIACQKRPVAFEDLENIAFKIESKLRGLQSDITTKKIGELVLKHLKKLDQVSYVRFASVYRDFQDLDSFKKELELLDAKV